MAPTALVSVGGPPLAVTLEDVTRLLDALVPLAWPVLVGVLLWRLLPVLRDVLASRGFTVKAGGAEITVQQASDQMLDRVEDLREQLSALKAQVGGDELAVTVDSSAIARGVGALRRVLWVDDHPHNNAYEIAALTRRGVSVELARSTAEALGAAEGAAPPFDAIITDMGRREDGEQRSDAGMELIDELRRRGVATPVFVYASASAVHRTRDRFEAAGARGTASATELLEMLGRVGAG